MPHRQAGSDALKGEEVRGVHEKTRNEEFEA